MESATIKLEYVKEEDRSNSFYCSKCKETYKGYCLKCSTLSRILNNASLTNTESNTVPLDILEIRDTSAGKGVFLLRTLPINIIFGPLEGVLAIESAVGNCWKINDNKLVHINNGNWMKYIVCAASASFKNLDIFQINGDLYFRTNREITEGEELLIYYKEEELQPLVNSEECLYTPQKQEKLPKVFACSLCCLGFGSVECLKEHKKKCPQVEHNRGRKDFELIECRYCKMWLEKWEHEIYHVAYCLENHYRIYQSEAVDQSEMCDEGSEGHLTEAEINGEYQCEICSQVYDRRHDLQLHIEEKHMNGNTEDNHQCHSQIKLESNSNERTIVQQNGAENSIEKKYKCSDCSYQTQHKSNLKVHRNIHKDIKPFKCAICKVKFTQKSHLKTHIKYKHTIDGSAKDYKCSECSYRTNYKRSLKVHLNTHKDDKAFQCYNCMKQFTTKNNLTMHIKSKHMEAMNDYKCSECPYQTNYRSSINRHQLNMHNSVKPINNIPLFECGVCMDKFSSKVNLQRHIKNKHREDKSKKDYKCAHCSYQTNQKYNLKVHLNTHKSIKPFQCDICMNKYTQKCHLASHIISKHTKEKRKVAEKRFVCQFCTKKYNRKDNLKAHMKNSHPEQELN